MKQILLSFSILMTLSSGLMDAAPAGKVSELAPGVYFMEVQTAPEFLGCNSSWVVFEDYVLVIDAGFPLSARSVVEEVKKTTDKPIRFVFDTHYHGDHSFGNGVYTAVGAVGVATELCIRDQRLKGPSGFAQQAESNSDLARRQVEGARFKDATIAFDKKLVFDDGKQRVELLHFGQAHTPGDAVAYLPRQKILFTGDACVNGSFNYMGDGDLENWIKVLDAMKELDVEKIGPGHGPLADKELLDKQQRYFVELRRQVGDGIEKGKSFDEIVSSLDMPFYQEWTGIPVEKNVDNIRHAYNELLGIQPPAYLTRDIGLREGPSPTKADANWTAPRKVLVPNVSPGKLALLKKVAPEVELVVYRTPAEAAKLAGDADGVIGACTAEILSAGQKLRWIQASSAGIDNYLSLAGLADRDIVLTNAQRVFGPEIGDHGIALLLALTRGLRSSVANQAANATWSMGADFDRSRFLELRGKNVLVVGLGGLGTEVARRAHAFGARVYAIDAKPTQRPEFVFHVGPPEELRSLAGKVHAVFSCLPLTTATTKLFNSEFFSSMQPTAYFVALGRGPSTDTDALLAALKAKTIAGAGLDVTDPEPLPAGHELYKLPNVIITPHIASQSDHRESRLFDLYRENLRRFAAGLPLLGVVDKQKGY